MGNHMEHVQVIIPMVILTMLNISIMDSLIQDIHIRIVPKVIMQTLCDSAIKIKRFKDNIYFSYYS